MDKTRIRKADFIAAFLIIAFGVFVVVKSTGMPMTASYGGVESHWYVAPALFPLFVGGMLILLGFALMGIAVRDGGLRALLAGKITVSSFRITPRAARTLTVICAIASFVYVFVPRIDFFAAVATFLFFLTTAFYPENDRIRRSIGIFFGAETLILALFALLGVWERLYSAYVYTFDILAILVFLAMVATAFRCARREGVPRGKIRTTLWLSFLVPAVICPLFRFPLRTPLPHEGLILDYMNLIVSYFRYGV